MKRFELRKGIPKKEIEAIRRLVKEDGAFHCWMDEKEVELLIKAFHPIISQLDQPFVPENLSGRKYEITAIRAVIFTLKIENNEEVEIELEY